VPPGSEGKYFIARLRGREVAAVGSIPESAPPAAMWNTYVWVDDADETASRATEAGGRVLAEPFDVMDAGRMAVLQDPTGAIFSVWQAKSHPGATRLNEVGSLVWTELYTRDTKKASAFYTGLFGWQTKPFPESPMPYTVFQRPGDERGLGGMLDMTGQLPAEVPPHWLPYFSVEDADKIVARSGELGGSVLMPATDIPTVGRLAILKDPQGAAFAIIKTAM
jgi:hypothetical protein